MWRKLIKPLGYLDFLKLLAHSKKIVTDSGGIQKEAYLLRKLCVTLRNTTEWLETIEDGWNVLVGTNSDKIRSAIEDNIIPIIHNEHYGDGKASEKICKIIEKNI